MDFPTFLSRTNKVIPSPLLICLDPGETTGAAIFVDGRLTRATQIETPTVKRSIPALTEFLDSVPLEGNKPIVVFENYKIYSWKTEQHTWASLHTPQVLGVIETLAYIRGWKTFRQMAQQPKQFCTDAKLKEWGYYKTGLRHARDAIRHGCYYLLFNNEPKK